MSFEQDFPITEMPSYDLFAHALSQSSDTPQDKGDTSAKHLTIDWTQWAEIDFKCPG